MQIGPFTIARTKAAGQLQSVESRGGWYPLIREAWAGAWQQNVEIRLANVLTHPTVFACISLISSDIAKMMLRLVEVDADGIWNETDSPSFSPVLRKPNNYQTRIAFIKSWLISKLAYGNTYILKERDQRRVVTALYVLDPSRVHPLVAPNGDVYYELKRDDLSGQVQDSVIVPASEIIHDIMVPLYHPLVGVSPIHACGLAATLGLKIQTNSANFFENGSNPGGLLLVPGSINDDQAARLKATFEAASSGTNNGRLIVLTAGMTYQQMSIPADKSQLSEQWKAAAEAICACFRVPAYLAGAADPPAYNNIEALNQAYYSQCLQELIEQLELLLDEGLGLGPRFGNRYGTEFDLTDLLRMDSATMTTTLAARVGAGIDSPNEARKQLNRGPVEGGETPYLQQQYWPLSQLSTRPVPVPAPLAQALPTDDDDSSKDTLARFRTVLSLKSFEAGWCSS